MSAPDFAAEARRLTIALEDDRTRHPCEHFAGGEESGDEWCTDCRIARIAKPFADLAAAAYDRGRVDCLAELTFPQHEAKQ